MVGGGGGEGRIGVGYWDGVVGLRVGVGGSVGYDGVG